ncbi:FAD-dependent oxidoreductase [Aspergillus novofumigatus IBT 16806]|uniref:FAD binding domain protein n=1 Tax=Aspergillus novofumigatus (strain IBT 16806) TaxID=1392255 RepID=A0A2I1BX66_ASPN1|nr:FAD binding domain protein [Aspergillus novofumigatus IBT 16806]PKX89962.1 FAD binding domain protein [Aspergillus novofumigatus IBT 16806]
MISSFRVIIVGGGVAGLTASHALQKAGIDHVVLERSKEVAPPVGASIAIYPHGARILSQIGCLEAARAACRPCERFITRGPDGKVWINSDFFGNVQANHGQDILLLERREFLQILYDCLPDKSFVKLGCRVRDVTQDSNGVEVILGDGTVERGDMVLGCDGVHSLVKQRMWDLANQNIPGVITTQEKTSMVTRWKCLVGMGPAAPELGERDMTVVHDDRYSFLFLTQPDKLFFFVFFRLDHEFRWPERRRYTDADAEALATSVASHPICETLVFGEIWQKRIRGSLISLEEGILQHWSHGRIVLAGDSVHKVTPNIALGETPQWNPWWSHHGGRVSRATLRRVFDQYQRDREARMHEIMELSSLITRVQAWDGILPKFLACWVLPFQADHKLTDQLGELIRKAPKLDYVKVDQEFGRGRLAWEDEKNSRSLDKVKKMAFVSRLTVYLAGCLTALVLAYSLSI